MQDSSKKNSPEDNTDDGKYNCKREDWIRKKG